MLFSSLEFIFLFLPLCLIFYFLLPGSWRNALLLAASLVFYAFGEPIYVFLMLATIFANILFARLIQKFSQKRSCARKILTLAVVFNLSLLFFFKYFGALADSFAALLDIEQSTLPSPALPIGISFYTFQALSYVIDVYRGEAEAGDGILVPATYITLFPQLIAGPIIKYGEISEQIRKRSHSLSLVAAGIRRFSSGLAKKVLLANTAGEIWEELALGFSLSRPDTLGAWLGVLFFAYQIYFDFSGYSDMAIGLGKIFGFDFPENFNYPYVADSITDFWRRWHITLSSWFRDYVYIPLGGNRHGAARTYLNLFAVWSLTGIWHGAGLNFLLWGMYFFILISLEKAFLKHLLKRLPRLVRICYTFILVLVGWLIFASDGTVGELTLDTSFGVFRTMLGLEGSLYSSRSLWELARNALVLALLVLSSLPFGKKLSDSILVRDKRGIFYVFLNLFSAVGILLSVAYLVNSGYNPFLYFKF